MTIDEMLENAFYIHSIVEHARFICKLPDLDTYINDIVVHAYKKNEELLAEEIFNEMKEEEEDEKRTHHPPINVSPNIETRGVANARARAVSGYI